MAIIAKYVLEYDLMISYCNLRKIICFSSFFDKSFEDSDETDLIPPYFFL
jgi:hypothetical protein